MCEVSAMVCSFPWPAFCVKSQKPHLHPGWERKTASKLQLLPTSFQTATGVALKKKKKIKSPNPEIIQARGRDGWKTRKKPNLPILVTFKWRRFQADCTL